MLVLAFLAGLGGMGYVINAIAIHRRRTRCPSCGARTLDTYDFLRPNQVDVAGKHFPASWSKHRCSSCGAAFMRYDRGGLITKEAFEAGARAALPEATVVRDRT